MEKNENENLFILGVHDLVDLLPHLVPELAVRDRSLNHVLIMLDTGLVLKEAEKSKTLEGVFFD